MEVGYAEFLMVVTVALAAFVSFMFHFCFTRVLTSLAICIAIAAIITPADPASCLFFGILLSAAYQIGRQFRPQSMPNIG